MLNLPTWKHIHKTYARDAHICFEYVFDSSVYIVFANPGRKDTEHAQIENMLKTYSNHTFTAWSICRVCFEYAFWCGQVWHSSMLRVYLSILWFCLPWGTTSLEGRTGGEGGDKLNSLITRDQIVRLSWYPTSRGDRPLYWPLLHVERLNALESWLSFSTNQCPSIPVPARAAIANAANVPKSYLQSGQLHM